MNNWGTGGHSVGLIVMIDENDFHRVGNCWMNGRLLKGDLAMAICHSGDCFWTYQLIDNKSHLGSSGHRGYKLIVESKFGAYALGRPYHIQPTKREMHLLLAGEHISLEADVVEESKAKCIKLVHNL
jgi:hypothetical protein